MPEFLFSYGTLQRDEVQSALFGRVLAGAPDALVGYTLAPVEVRDEAFLAKGESKNQQTTVRSNDDTDVIEGTALKISTEELLLADKYEPENYERVKVVLQSGKEAWIYAVIRR
jgi:hypothetical protein